KESSGGNYCFYSGNFISYPNVRDRTSQIQDNMAIGIRNQFPAFFNKFQNSSIYKPQTENDCVYLNLHIYEERNLNSVKGNINCGQLFRPFGAHQHSLTAANNIFLLALELVKSVSHPNEFNAKWLIVLHSFTCLIEFTAFSTSLIVPPEAVKHSYKSFIQDNTIYLAFLGAINGLYNNNTEINTRWLEQNNADDSTKLKASKGRFETIASEMAKPATKHACRQSEILKSDLDLTSKLEDFVSSDGSDHIQDTSDKSFQPPERQNFDSTINNHGKKIIEICKTITEPAEMFNVETVYKVRPVRFCNVSSDMSPCPAPASFSVPSCRPSKIELSRDGITVNGKVFQETHIDKAIDPDVIENQDGCIKMITRLVAEVAAFMEESVKKVKVNHDLANKSTNGPEGTISNQTQESINYLKYAMDFGSIVKESLKRTTNWSAKYFTHPRSYYPVPVNHMKLSDAVYMTPLPSITMSQEDQQLMRDWLEPYRPVRQRTVRSETTKDKAGALPPNVYVNASTAFQTVDFDTDADCGMSETESTQANEQCEEVNPEDRPTRDTTAIPPTTLTQVAQMLGEDGQVDEYETDSDFKKNLSIRTNTTSSNIATYVELHLEQLLFNNVLTSGKFPESWTEGLITPIHKLGNSLDPNNYR
ncbi:Hypothetical predicted protein, partial [Paramuricea clavata]